MKRTISTFMLFVLLINTLSSSLMLPQVLAESANSETIVEKMVFINAQEEEIPIEQAEGEGQIKLTFGLGDVDTTVPYEETLTLPENIEVAVDQTGDMLPGNGGESVGQYIVKTDRTLRMTTNEQASGQTGTIIFNAAGLAQEPPSEEVSEETAAFSTTAAAMNTEITTDFIVNTTVKKDGSVLENGTELNIEPPYSNTVLELRYDFELVNEHGYGTGAFYKLTVPSMFEIPNISETNAAELKRGDGTVFGSFYTEGNDIVITFNEIITTESNITGQIQLEANIDDNYNGPAEGDTLVFPFGEEATLEFPISFKPDENGLDKKGIGNRGYNTEFITWTVDVNKNLQTITDTQLTDVIPKGDHTFIADSFKVYALSVNADGSVQEPLNDVTDAVLNDNFQLDVATDAKSFNLDMGEIDSAYRIEYRTEVNDRVGEEYKNGAILTGADDLNLTTDATVAVTRGNPLAKTSSNYDDVAQTIDWEVKYNYDEKTIPQGRATLIDEFGNVNQTLDVDSFEIYQVSINPDTGEETGETLYENYTLTENENGYTVQFNESIDGAFKLKYRTNTIDRVENDAEVTNTISDDFENTAGGNQGIGQGILIKNNTGANYQDKTTDWSITINRDEELMQETIFKDTLPVGFTFQPDTLSVEGYDGDYDVTYDTNDTNNQYITIHFNGDITERVTLSYRTDIDYNAVERDAEGLVKASYLNDASVDWIPENQETSVKKKATAAFNPDDFTRNNGFKYGSYNVASKEMTWTIGVNYNEEDLQGVKVTDSLIGDQNFTKEDVKVYQMNLTPGANEFELGTEVTSEFTISDLTEPGFEVDFGDITTGYVIIFTTDFKDQQVAETYENTATVSSTNREPATLEASVSPRFGGEYTTKEGQQNTDNGRIVNWTVNINRSQSLLNDLVIKDTPSINQSLVQDSFVIYETTATADNIVKNEGATLEEGTDYDLEFSAAENGQESFTITFKGDKQEIEEAYVLTYDTYILYKGDGNIGNDLSISGDQVVENTGGSSVNRAISFNSISGSITGEVGSLVIKKVDAEDITLLEGAEFQLYDESGEVLLRTGTTDSAGNLTFVNLLYGNYQLKEVTPPDGYVIDRTVGDTRVVTVDSNAGTVDNPDVTVENYKIKRDVRLTKVDGTTNDKLAGVEFELFQADDTQVTSFTETDLTTNASGEIYLEDLAPGDYYFKEKTPIANYQANTNEYSFTIKEDHIILDIDADALTVENELIPGRGEMRKIDADKLDTANNGLAGARFRIESTDDGISFGRTVTSGENGLIETGDLRPGNYTIEETSAPNGFTLSERDPIAFTIPLNTVSADTVTISSDPFENNVKTTAIEVTKQDSINGQLLPGAEFELTYSNGDYDLDSSPRTGVTDESGKVTFDDLKPGTYQLKETKTPDGYISSSTPIEITVTLGDVHNARVIRETVENAPYANVTLKKVDAETSTALAGAIFDVEDTSGGKITGYENITTDENGNISITGLPAGTYQLRETQAPDGYTIQTGGYLSDPFTVDAGVTETEGISLGNVGNDIIKGSVKLVKVDGDTTDNLENVEFQLEAISLVNGGTYETTTHSTDANGEIIIDDLRPGTYRFVETGPLSGYQPYWGTSSFTLNFPHDEDQVEVEVRNYQRISIDVEKVWNDQSNVDNRPESVTIELLRNGAQREKPNN
ncbi:Uncharacterized surface anchored protein [Halolactibacillus halophilus]|uniref:Uncharacterized surface anchored protein n=1 Tax=Halolactibacillus halophilus TaxID=306540 RepID=A0A1I5SZ82_9BACI|nr:Uncharacterized surface anchored protein [Halolactibacillus halophilus]